MYCPKCGSELKFEEAEICPACGARLKAAPKPPNEDPCGCGQFLSLFSIFIGAVFLFVIFYPTADTGFNTSMIIVGLIFLGGGIAFFARKERWF